MTVFSRPDLSDYTVSLILSLYLRGFRTSLVNCLHNACDIGHGSSPPKASPGEDLNFTLFGTVRLSCEQADH